jgi:DNA-binding winged helix-turn-helix (wHTH) protein
MIFSGGAAQVAFGSCILDVQSRELCRNGKTTTLAPKVFRLLTVLLEHRPRAIAKRELHDRVWPGTFVSESTLVTLVAELRRVIGDAGEHAHLIRTVHGFGYAFSGDVGVVSVGTLSGHPACYLINRDSHIALQPGPHFVGRMRNSTVWIDDPSVSRQHAQIVVTPEGATLQDLGSKNGTYLNDERLETTQALNDGDRIIVGPAHMQYRVRMGDRSTVTRM